MKPWMAEYALLLAIGLAVGYELGARASRAPAAPTLKPSELITSGPAVSFDAAAPGGKFDYRIDCDPAGLCVVKARFVESGKPASAMTPLVAIDCKAGPMGPQ